MPVDQRLFRESIWLGRLTPETVTDLASKAIVRRLANGELWISRADRANGIAIIVEGGLRSTTYTKEGREYVFSIMKKGDIWGLVSTIDGTYNANDVYAYGATTILSISRQTVLWTMATRPDFSKCLMDILCHRLRMANTVLEDRALKPIEVRLARLLLSLRGTDPVLVRNGGRSCEAVAVTQDMLAKILGCTRPTVNKQLKKLERDGLLKVEYGRIHLSDTSKILDVAGSAEYYYF